MTRAVLPALIALAVAGCATTSDTLATAQPRLSYSSEKSPDTLANCIVNEAANTNVLGFMMQPPPIVRDGESRRLHFDRNANIFAHITPEAGGSHLDFYFDTIVGIAGRGGIEKIVRSCR